MSAPIVLNLSRVPLAALTKLRSDLDIRQGPTDSASLTALAEVVAVITDAQIGMPIPADSLPNLRVMISIGSGVEKFDRLELSRRSIRLVPLSGVFSRSVAGHALMLNSRLDSARRLDRPQIGIIGMGAIGSLIADHFNGEGLEVRYRNRAKRNDSHLQHCDSVDHLCELSDIVFISCPGGTETKSMIAAAQLQRIGPSGRLINVGRGSVVDSDALFLALSQGQIGDAGLDVFDGSPDLRSRLEKLPNVVITNHVAWKSPSATADVLRSLDQILRDFFPSPP